MVLDFGQVGIYFGEKNLILGIDPGRDKTGFAFVNFEGELISSGIFISSEREKFFDILINNENISEYIIEGGHENLMKSVSFIAVGNGTNSKNFYDFMKNKLKNEIEIKVFDEKNTTLEARKLYWKIHKPGFFVKLLPENMRVPKRILDDLAAWAIVLRYLKKTIEI